jgi:putative ABC transport system permease protein
MVKGNPVTALSRPYTLVLTETLARKYFGDDNPIGQTIKSVEGNQYEVTGVIEDLPGNAHLKFDGLLSAATFRELVGAERFNDRSSGSFWNIGVFSYVLLKPGAGFDPILEKFPAFYNKYMKSVGDMINGSFTLMAKPLARVHHYSSDLAGDEPGKHGYICFCAVAIYPCHCLHQLHESCHSPLCQKIQGNRDAKNSRGPAKDADTSIPHRIPVDCCFLHAAGIVAEPPDASGLQYDRQ